MSEESGPTNGRVTTVVLIAILLISIITTGVLICAGVDLPRADPGSPL